MADLEMSLRTPKDSSVTKNKFRRRGLEEDHDSREEKRMSRRNICCAWVSLLIGTFILIVLLVGIILFSFFASNLPAFHLSSLEVNKLQFTTSKTDTFMDSNIIVTLNATNTKDRIQFLYTKLRADIYSNDVVFGRVRLLGFHQNATNSTLMKLHSVLQQQPVAEPDASKLKSDLQSSSLSIDVILKGLIHYEIRGHRISGFPFRVSCKDMIQYAINQNQQSCTVKMTPIT